LDGLTLPTSQENIDINFTKTKSIIMTDKTELIIEIGAEGGSFFAYRIKGVNDNYSYYFGTNEMGLDDNEIGGISTRSKELITDFNVLLEKIRIKYPEIYNLHPIFVHPEYSTKVLYDLRNRIKNIHFDYRGWAIVLYLLVNRNETEKYTEDDVDKIEPQFIKTLKCIDLIDTKITDENTITKELLENFSILDIDSDTEEEGLVIYDNYNYLASLSMQELDNIYKVLARCNPGKRLPIMINIEKITVERLEKIEVLSTDLSKIHNKYNLFSQSDFKNIQKENNIIEFLEDFSYLRIFYENYAAQFDDNFQKKINRKEAINNDLPFIGEKAIYNDSVDFIFYFEGSRQNKKKISITVLSHLWLTDEETIIDKFCGKNKWWTKANFLNIKNRLAIDNRVLERSYISDALRFDNDEINKELIQKEIEFFKPKLVICIGTKARDLVGMRYYNFPVKFHYVKFPKYHSNNKIYEELNGILKNFRN